MSIESEVYLDLARIWNLGPGEVEKMVRDYIGAVTCDFEPLKLYSKPHIHIEPIKIKSLRERLEEIKMKNDIYPLVVVLDRYNGTYSGGKWTAWNLNYVPSKIDADDMECADFFSKNTIVYGRGETPQEAIDDLKMILNCGIPDPGEEDEDEEDMKMKATSTEVFEDIIAIDFELQTFPNPDEQDKFIVSATNRDDIFAFEFEGPYLADACRKAGLLNGWEKDQRIRELEEKVKQLEHDNMFDKETAEYWSNEYSTLSEKFAKLQEVKHQKIREKDKEIDKLKQQFQQVEEDKERLTERYKALENQYNLEEAANEAQHKFIREYSGKCTEVQFNYAIDDAKEVSYLIVDKERYNKLYEKWVKMQSEQDSHKYTRADILDQAKKCVCGQREQDYGTPESNFQLIADLWNDYLGITDYVLELQERIMDLKDKGVDVNVNVPDPSPILSVDVAMMMALLKIARIRNGGGSGDSFVDLAGYAACGGEIWAGQKNQKDQN